MPRKRKQQDQLCHYYRSATVFFITYASAFRGISPHDYIDGYKRGLFHMPGNELVGDEAFGAVEKTEMPALLMAQRYGEDFLTTLWEMAELEEAVFGK